ncbi:hypothetical protein TNCV_4269231 [Trichonephila clavipes]|nr:hypothetical protein TNCV_4269231 [Trichonephila clavipes]
MSSRHHIDDFIRGRIIGKIEECRKITDVAREFDIAHTVVSRLWKSFKTTGMCSRRHGERSYESRFSLSSDFGQRHELIWRESGTAYRPENIQEADIRHAVSWCGAGASDQWPHAPTCSCEWYFMTGQRYIDEVLLPHVRLFRGACR